LLYLATTVLDSRAYGTRPTSSKFSVRACTICYTSHLRCSACYFEFHDRACHSIFSGVWTARGARARGLERRSVIPYDHPEDITRPFRADLHKTVAVHFFEVDETLTRW